MLSETNFSGGGPSQLQQNDYSYMSVSPDFTFQALTQGANALAKVAAKTAAATAKAIGSGTTVAQQAAVADGSARAIGAAVGKHTPPGTLGEFQYAPGYRAKFESYSTKKVQRKPILILLFVET